MTTTITLTHGRRCGCGKRATRHIERDGACGNVCGVHGRSGVLHDRAVMMCGECGEHITEGGQIETFAIGMAHGKSGTFHRACYERFCSWCNGAGSQRDGKLCPKCDGEGYADV